MSLKQVMFETASATEDWRLPYRLIVPGVNGWDPAVDEVVLGMSPDQVTWDDYGSRTRTFPPTGTSDTSPWFYASSQDGTGTVALIDPNLIDIVVPWNIMRSMGIGSIAVGIQLRNQVTGSRTNLLTGRLPLADGVV